MNTHNVRANRRVNGAQHGHYVRIMTEQKERTRVRRARKCRACMRFAHSLTYARRHAHDDDDDVALLLLSISPTSSAKMLTVAGS